ncbi:MAG: copper amine oxidase N-terminal domain-containing protein [Bacillota bacterium]|nr:copper amine oxidase N-terminal domain-containing protein [Bacillota bacterium]
MKNLIKGFVLGFLSALIISAVVYGQVVEKNISAFFENIKIYVDGKIITPKDVNGKTVEPFISDGTTYLPIRAVAGALSKEVEWNAGTKSVYIGGVPKDETDTYSSPQIEGCKIFPEDNFWNTPIDNLPIHPKSEQYINSIGKSKSIHPDFGTIWEGKPIGIPYNVVSDNQSMSKVKFEYEDESDPGPYPIPANPLIESGSDRHLLILRKGSNILYELYNAVQKSDGSWQAGSGAIWNLNKNETRPKGWTSADAAGLAIFPGLVKWEEVYKNGEINHALRVTLNKIQKSYILPASHSGGGYKDENYPPMGLRLRLKAGFDISKFDARVQVILRALKKYGMVVADVGSDMYISGCPDSRWNDEILSSLNKVNAGNFEAVYTGEAIPY